MTGQVASFIFFLYENIDQAKVVRQGKQATAPGGRAFEPGAETGV